MLVAPEMAHVSGFPWASSCDIEGCSLAADGEPFIEVASPYATAPMLLLHHFPSN